jgi:hypothetical protein
MRIFGAIILSEPLLVQITQSQTHPLSYGCPTTIFRDPRNRHRRHLCASLLDGRAGWALLL